MHPTDDLIPILKKLRLSGVLNSLELRTKQAAEGDLSHCEFLLRVLMDEIERRDAKQLDMRLRRASFEHAKSLEDFEFASNPKIPRSQSPRSSTSPRVASFANVRMSASSGPAVWARVTSPKPWVIGPVSRGTACCTFVPTRCSSNSVLLGPTTHTSERCFACKNPIS